MAESRLSPSRNLQRNQVECSLGAARVRKPASFFLPPHAPISEFLRVFI